MTHLDTIKRLTELADEARHQAANYRSSWAVNSAAARLANQNALEADWQAESYEESIDALQHTLEATA